MGAASAVVAFFRSMGGSIGVSALGAVLGHRVAADLSEVPDLIRGGQVTPEQVASLQDGSVPHMETLPAPLREVFATAFGDATGHLFLVSVPFAVLALVCVLFIEETRLKTTLAELSEPEVDMEVAAEPGLAARKG